MMEEQRVRKPSPAKSEVAKKKYRDEQGHFVSSSEIQAIESRKQQMQLQAERDRMNALMGRQTAPPITQRASPPVTQQVPQGFQPQQYVPQPSNFQQIINANKPGSNEDINRWNKLLGRDKTSQNKKKNYRW